HGLGTCAAYALVPQSLVLVAGFTKTLSGGSHSGGRSAHPGRVWGRIRRLFPALRGCASVALHGERDEQPAPVWLAECRPLREGRHQRLRRRGQAGRGKSTTDWNQGGGALPGGCRAG